jgi:hypothetical protein
VEENPMRIEIRLKQVLRAHQLDRHGVEKRIASELRVHRQVIGRLCNNQCDRPSLDLLGEVCGWLSRHGVPANELPHSLFSLEPPELWRAIAQPGAVGIYVGEYLQGSNPILRWIARRDQAVATEYLEFLATAMATAVGRLAVSIHYVPFYYAATRSPGHRQQFLEDVAYSRQLYDRVRGTSRSVSPILIGSQKVNYLTEHFVANLFGCEAFRPCRGRPLVPFYLAYRDSPPILSCFGGANRLPGQRKACQPGIHYLDEGGRWASFPWDQERRDAGVVIIAYEPGMKSIEVAVLGFSGRGTEALGRELMTSPGKYWNLPAERKGKRIGVYVVGMDVVEDEASDTLMASARRAEVVNLSPQLLRQFLA